MGRRTPQQVLEDLQAVDVIMTSQLRGASWHILISEARKNMSFAKNLEATIQNKIALSNIADSYHNNRQALVITGWDKQLAQVQDILSSKETKLW